VQQLLGDIAMQRQRYSDAIIDFRKAYDMQKNADHAIGLYRAYSMSGNTAMALVFAQSWARDNPADQTARRVLAEAYLAAGHYPEARQAYQGILSQDKDDPAALNNLANVLLQLGDKGAPAMAERAYKVAPQDPNVADTLGLILLKSGQAERSLKYLREARIRAPGNVSIREHLAQALETTGRADEARKERVAAQSQGISH
jgi:Flp pilus assembly protein TadD